MALTEQRFMELMAQMTEKQNSDLEKRLASQLESIRVEMTTAFKSISDRQDILEAEQGVLVKQLEVLQQQMGNIKNNAELILEPSYSSVVSASAKEKAKEPSNPDKVTEKMNSILDIGRRTVGLEPFSQKDVDNEFKRGAKDVSEAKIWAVKNFLRYEMNIKPHISETFNLEKIFSPDKEDWNVMYVTFGSVTEANTVYSYTRNMRREVHIRPYIPKEWYSRFRALEADAFYCRKQLDYKTRVKWGVNDLVIYVKKPGENSWSLRQPPTDLPPVDLSVSGKVSWSPAPGRQNRDNQQQTVNTQKDITV